MKRIHIALLLSLLIHGAFAWADSQVHSLFNAFDFLENKENILSEEFWSSPRSVLYGKPVADWNDEDFQQLDAALQDKIYSLYNSSNPYRTDIIGQLQNVVEHIPKFKQWSAYARLNTPIGDSGGNGASKGWEFSWSHLLEQQIPLIPALGVLLALGGALAGGWHIRNVMRVRRRLKYQAAVAGAAAGGDTQPVANPPESGAGIPASPSPATGKSAKPKGKADPKPLLACPKCGNTDPSKLTIGRHAPESTLFKPLRKYYCHACDYKWIARQLKFKQAGITRL
ncbi:hypothetical protein [Methylomagnum ishizawai]|uniref:hypothetical protein n=1 Tax=Methylomagnum ishizawai TaxID=1760988 RepID=UPI001C32E7C1|nr:hypothetical protein [Methylomagnum ishizawai]BBL75205.1 hypothetical protein MishRS11D_23030 [Methylomagnum ishizawai]